MAVTKFYHPKVHTGWHKGDKLVTRRRKALVAHKGNYLSTAYSLQALANTTRDKPTAKAAKVDANYFFRMHKKKKK